MRYQLIIVPTVACLYNNIVATFRYHNGYWYNKIYSGIGFDVLSNCIIFIFHAGSKKSILTKTMTVSTHLHCIFLHAE